MKTLTADIKARSFKRVYLLYGEEEFLKKSYKGQLRSAIAGDDTMNTMEMDGNQVNLVAVKDFLMTMPFFAEYRLVVLSDTGLFASSADEWTDMIAQIPDTAVLIFEETKVDKRSKLYKAVNKIGYACEMKKPGDNELMQWTAQLLKKDGKVITRPTCEALLMRAGDNMENLRTQLEKLICYVGECQEITMADVEDVCTEQAESQVFRMLDAATEGRSQVALSLYYDMLALREPSMRIMYLIGRQCNQLLLVREMAAAGVGSGQIASELKLQPFVVTKTIKQSRAFTPEQLRGFVQMCVELEELVKTGRMNEKIAVETALIRICNRR
jgi:DNA polymerase-3 subunit delta